MSRFRTPEAWARLQLQPGAGLPTIRRFWGHRSIPRAPSSIRCCWTRRPARFGRCHGRVSANPPGNASGAERSPFLAASVGLPESRPTPATITRPRSTLPSAARLRSVRHALTPYPSERSRWRRDATSRHGRIRLARRMPGCAPRLGQSPVPLLSHPSTSRSRCPAEHGAQTSRESNAVRETRRKTPNRARRRTGCSCSPSGPRDRS